MRFYYDFGSPNAYLAHRVIPDIERRTGAQFQYVPILLGGLFKMTGNRPAMMAFAEVPNKMLTNAARWNASSRVMISPTSQ